MTMDGDGDAVSSGKRSHVLSLTPQIEDKFPFTPLFPSLSFSMTKSPLRPSNLRSHQTILRYRWENLSPRATSQHVPQVIVVYEA